MTENTLTAAIVIVLSSLSVIGSGCVSNRSDVRQAMLEVARKTDKDFPDGRREVLTQFAYLGTVDSNGGVIRVVLCRSVLTAMLAPRGEGWLLFFDSRNVLLGPTNISVSSPPLCCDGSKVFFFGVQQDGDEEGNALELHDGLEHRRLVYSRRIGSWMPADAASGSSERTCKLIDCGVTPPS